MPDMRGTDPDDFRAIIRDYGEDLLRLAFHFVNDWDEAADLTQVTLIKCYRSLKRYDPQRPFRAWLYRIHLNTCKSAARRAARRRLREVRLDAAADPGAPPPASDDTDLILRHIARLPARQRAAFVLIEIEGLTAHEAAYSLGCSDSTVRVHLARAKQALRRTLMSLGIGDESAG